MPSVGWGSLSVSQISFEVFLFVFVFCVLMRSFSLLTFSKWDASNGFWFFVDFIGADAQPLRFSAAVISVRIARGERKGNRNAWHVVVSEPCVGIFGNNSRTSMSSISQPKPHTITKTKQKKESKTQLDLVPTSCAVLFSRNRIMLTAFRSRFFCCCFGKSDCFSSHLWSHKIFAKNILDFLPFFTRNPFLFLSLPLLLHRSNNGFCPFVLFGLMLWFSGCCKLKRLSPIVERKNFNYDKHWQDINIISLYRHWAPSSIQLCIRQMIQLCWAVRFLSQNNTQTENWLAWELDVCACVGQTRTIA